MVRHGAQREFRAKDTPLKWDLLKTPTPVVAFRDSQSLGRQEILMVLEDSWTEPLGAISRESLAAECCESIGEFRRKWLNRTGRRFPPNQNVRVFRVRPLTSDDRAIFADMIFEHLYGPWASGSSVTR